MPTLEERVEKLERENRSMADFLAIWKLQSTYVHYMNLGMRLSIVGLFADSPDVEIELSNKGVLRGADAPRRYFTQGGRVTSDDAPRPAGSLVFHTAVNPAIEISPDGLRAKCVWLSPGITNSFKDGKPVGNWNYGKYDMEYLKQGGVWKILCFRWRQIFMTPYDKGWTVENVDPGFSAYTEKPDRPSEPGFYAPYSPDKQNYFAHRRLSPILTAASEAAADRRKAEPMDTETDPADRIRTERRGHVLIITINRPEARNAFDQVSGRGMTAAMDVLDAEDDLFIGIITGAGGNFSAGADLKAAARGESSRTERGGFGMFARPARKPLIAAVEGYAVGGGFELCLACDLIVAAKTAKMGLPEVRHNVVATGGGLIRLPMRIPYHIAMELALTGEFRDAEFFHRIGVVNRLVEEGQALEAALAWAEKLQVNGPMAMAASKEVIFNTRNWTEEEAWREQQVLAQKSQTSEDRAEGLKAFAEKRKPVWRGR